MKNHLIIFLILFYVPVSFAQELNAEIRVNAPTLKTTAPEQIDQLQEALREFLNTTTWTNDNYQPHERIKCNFALTITQERGDNTFLADLSIQSTRPVYGSNYETPVFTYQDKDILFTYETFKPLENNRDNFRDNLSAVFTYYAYLIIGMDNDTFSPYGGDKYLSIVSSLVNQIPPGLVASNPGWAPQSKRNRYWLIENYLSPKARSYRQAMYDYHLKGLDVMHNDAEKGRDMMFKALQTIENVRNNDPSLFIIQLFSSAKQSEIISVFKVATPQMKNNVYRIMSTIDPANSSRYEEIRS